MGRGVMLLGAIDDHPERSAKLPKFLSVFCEVSDSVTLVSSSCPPEYRDKVNWIIVASSSRKKDTKSGRLWSSLHLQMRLVYILLSYGWSERRVVTLRRYLLPSLVARLMGKRPIRYHAGPSYRAGPSGGLNLVSEYIANTAYFQIAVPSSGCVSQFLLQGFRKKVVIGPFHVTKDFFQATPNWSNRSQLVGYFGNMTFESARYRAVDRLIQGVRILREQGEEVRLVLGGVGPVVEDLGKDNQEGVIFVGWISHDEGKEWLDSIRLLVLPSIDEGLATILLQAMARGTPVLATSVAGNPDVIVDGETGFLMGDTNPECVAENIQRAIRHPDLRTIAENGRWMVEGWYCYDRVVERWSQILDSESKKNRGELGGE